MPVRLTSRSPDGSRTRNHLVLSEAALPFGVPGSYLRTPGGTRTHTDQNLNLVPLPIGLQEHIGVWRWVEVMLPKLHYGFPVFDAGRRLSRCFTHLGGEAGIRNPLRAAIRLATGPSHLAGCTLPILS